LMGGSDNTWQEDDGYSFHRLATDLSDNVDPVSIPLLSDLTDASGDVGFSYSWQGSSRAVTITARKSPDGGTRYIGESKPETITTLGLSTTLVMDTDTVAS